MQKILFLDIDGVLISESCIKDFQWKLLDEKQILLKEILDKTDTKIVLSSSWRKHNLKETIEFMNQEGFWFSEKIIGITIRAYHYLKKPSSIHLGIPRGVEIKQWIDTNIHSNNGKDYKKKQIGIDYNYVIIDDDSDMLLEQKDHFIQVDGYVGLTKEHVDIAIKILNKTK